MQFAQRPCRSKDQAPDCKTGHFGAQSHQRVTSGKQNRQYVYVIGEKGGNGPVKIGVSRSPKKRLRGLQTSCPFKL
ncbi:MAG: GIY-YIG nuclease family protein, partial [Rhodoplanes sp.]